ncbi:hypothetical protein SAMN02910370_02003 [Lachnospiraceae bacterium XPB1003]|nr:hypothetical protein SAMN02910370_02003 [Lachnospiraceae bacterium XPB1003]
MDEREEEPIVLRPHHLLCTQGYSGNGYSTEFVEHMNEVVERLRYGDDRIRITFSTDTLCSCCPNKTGEDQCVSQDKVKKFDGKVTEYFGIEEKEYRYREIIKEVDSKMTSDIMDDICGGCSWYPVSACKKNIIGS